MPNKRKVHMKYMKRDIKLQFIFQGHFQVTPCTLKPELYTKNSKLDSL